MEIFEKTSRFWLEGPFFDSGEAQGDGSGDANSGDGSGDGGASSGAGNSGEPAGNVSDGGDGQGDGKPGKQTEDAAGQQSQISALLERVGQLETEKTDLGKTVGKQAEKLGKFRDLERRVSGDGTLAAGAVQPNSQGQIVLTPETLPAFMEALKSQLAPAGDQGVTRPNPMVDNALRQVNSVVGQVGDFLVEQRLSKSFTPEERQQYESVVVNMAEELMGDPENGLTPTLSMREVLHFAARGRNHQKITEAAGKVAVERYIANRAKNAEATLPGGTGKPSGQHGAQANRGSRVVDANELLKQQEAKAEAGQPAA